MRGRHSPKSGRCDALGASLCAQTGTAPYSSPSTSGRNPNRRLIHLFADMDNDRWQSRKRAGGLDDDGAARPLIITNYDWRNSHARHRRSGVALHHSGCVARARAAEAPDTAIGAVGAELTAAQAFRTPQLAAIAFTFFACCATHSGPIFHMVTHAIDRGVPTSWLYDAFGSYGWLFIASSAIGLGAWRLRSRSGRQARWRPAT
jgi:hypothetical protein